MKKTSLIFFGSSKYSVIDEKALYERFGLSSVVTIPDRIDPKTKLPIISPVKVFAQKNNIPIIQTTKLTPDVIESLKTYSPDFLVVADFRLILPKELLSIPRYAPLNVHHSLLPKFRGPSPAPAAILSEDRVTGVTIIKISERVDDGDILKQVLYEMRPDETTDSLLTVLNTLGSQAVIEVITSYLNGDIHPQKQDDSKATYSRYIDKQDGFIDFTKPIDKLHINRMIRAYYPWPGVWTIFREPHTPLTNKIIKLLPNPSPINETDLILIQVEGKKLMTKKDFLNGYPFTKDWLEKII